MIIIMMMMIIIMMMLVVVVMVVVMVTVIVVVLVMMMMIMMIVMMIMMMMMMMMIVTLSISLIIFLISSFLGSNPSALMATLSSLASIVPDPSVSNRSKASRISCFCSSVNSNFLFLAPPALFACVHIIMIIMMVIIMVER